MAVDTASRYVLPVCMVCTDVNLCGSHGKQRFCRRIIVVIVAVLVAIIAVVTAAGVYVVLVAVAIAAAVALVTAVIVAVAVVLVPTVNGAHIGPCI